MLERRLHLPPLDGLRGIAALMVVFGHAGRDGYFFELENFGQLGVMIFFVLSGFLMGYLYLQPTITGTDWTVYGMRRFFRVYPAFAVICVLSWFLLTTSLWDGVPFPLDTPSLLRHLALQGETGVLWTVAVEMAFYVCFPIFAWLALRAEGDRRLLLLAVLFGALAFVDFGGNRVLVWKYFEFFIGGMLASQLFLRTWSATAQRRITLLASPGVVIGLALMIPLSGNVFEAITGFRHGLWKTGIAFAALSMGIVLSAAWSTGRVQRLLTSKPALRLGAISFSLYLVHLPVIRAVHEVTDRAVPGLVLVVVLSLLLAEALHRTVERPMLRYGRRLEPRRIPA